jgi:hypothetical protein
MQTTLSPKYQAQKTPVEKLGVTGDGASPASQALIRAGYNVVDLGGDSTKALTAAKKRSIPFVAIVAPVGTEGSWWDGFFDYRMRVTRIKTGQVVWSASAEYGSAGVFIDQDGSTSAAMRDMVAEFSNHFPPQDRERGRQVDPDEE